ncbi:MAG: hypothetical protein LBI40_02385 [Treponema sp.]|nr:hypothetical protein [Treponema sp.]
MMASDTERRSSECLNRLILDASDTAGFTISLVDTMSQTNIINHSKQNCVTAQ